MRLREGIPECAVISAKPPGGRWVSANSFREFLMGVREFFREF